MLAWTVQIIEGGSPLFFRGARSPQAPSALGARLGLTPAPAPSLDESQLTALVHRLQQGDVTAFDRLYQLTREDAARTLHHLVGNRTDVEDLLQETYLRLLSAVKGFRGEARFRTFLYRVCANVALSHLRWKRRRPEDPVATPPEAFASNEDPEREAERRQAARLVEQALERLKPKKRIVFVYYELCGMTPDEIAEAVGSSANTVRSRLHHARLEFTEAMQRLLDTPRAGGPHGTP
ncbi:RNA polymerase sigma factor [Hyalangium rubrum]|uniref:Sigma-70 family RNA polymerase sigma factor n=1 Tax=Hyalangium rubrum TaxID=3103134 RepID=A0ABU5H7I4_9BACT|nr:sigma-70 family RNA polymerase sigma factor [Hyalangium sp. s54d21]MDY7228717.1 sigma-70 family RNA polymerase sigma factor [Hyalangium sp. s54d21]